MDSKNLEKWRIIDNILEDHSFEIKHTLDDWNHCYYSDNFDGHIEYDIDGDEMTIFDKENNVLESLCELSLNDVSVMKTLITYGL